MSGHPPPTLRTAQLLAAAIAFGLITVVGVLSFLFTPWDPATGIEPVLDPALGLPLAALPLLFVVVAPRLIRRVLGPKPDNRPSEWVERLQREVIITFTILEGSGIAMVILTFLSGRGVLGIGLALLALLQMALNFPTTERVRARVDALALER